MASRVRLRPWSHEDVWPSPSRVTRTALGIWSSRPCAQTKGVEGSWVALASRIGGAPRMRARWGGLAIGTGQRMHPRPRRIFATRSP
ncbi:MAG: hypothetical protein QOK40_659 [Miltoncostaeaceae bacterium]|nr:hypothetical protein [Miltoncostaeaceae bacterium]